MAYIVGFIGLGHMGLPMALNLLKSELVTKLYVYDLAKEPMQILEKQGAIIASDIKKIANTCDIIFTMLQSGDQVADVCLSEKGIFKNHKAGLIYIDCSSINVTTSRELHSEAKNHNIKMLDAPVSGGVKGAAAASLTIMVGGESQLLDSVKPILNLLGHNVINAGKAGNGQVAKICNNMILGVSMIAVSEAFNLGKKLGLEPQHLFDIVSKGSGQCWSLTSYCPYPDILEQVPSSNEYKPGFTAQMMLKDLRLSQKAANSVDAATPMGALASSLYSLFADSHGHEDFSGIIKFLDSGNK